MIMTEYEMDEQLDMIEDDFLEEQERAEDEYDAKQSEIEEAYQQGRADAISEISREMRVLYGNEYERQIRADAFSDCVLENGEYCWQECCSTEHCKECKWLGNGDTIWFEQMQKGEVLGFGAKETLSEYGEVLGFDAKESLSEYEKMLNSPIGKIIEDL